MSWLSVWLKGKGPKTIFQRLLFAMFDGNIKPIEIRSIAIEFCFGVLKSSPNGKEKIIALRDALNECLED